MAAHHHDHHHHVPSRDADGSRLAIALGLILALMVGEVVVGLLANSLALLADAAHMLTDAGAIALSLVAIRLAARPPAGALTFGLGRAEILSAQANGITLLVLGLLIVWEGVNRLIDPPEVVADPVLVVALVGVAVNLLATWVLAGANRQSLNVEGSFQHVVTDLYAFLATAVAAGIVLATGWAGADAVASLVVAALMLRSSYGLIRASGRVFLEAAPEGLDPGEIGRALASQPDVTEVHDLHVWEITSGFPALAAHVLVAPERDCHAIRRRLEGVLEENFGIAHTTLQVDHEPAGELLTITVVAEPRDP